MLRALTRKGFEAGSRGEVVTDSVALVITVVVTVKTDSGVVREAMFASFIASSASKLDTANIGSLCVCIHVGVENNSSLFICS